MNNRPTKIFDKPKVTRMSFDKELKEGDDKYFEGAFGWVGLTLYALAWLILASLFNWTAQYAPVTIYLYYGCIALASICVLLWTCIYVIPKVWRWLIGLVAIMLIMVSCSKEGEVTGRSTKTIKINDKEYYFMKVIPEDGAKGVWLLIPNDATVELPKVTSYDYTQSCGKNCHKKVTVSCIWIL